MRIQDLSDKNICIVGFGREGKAMAEALEKYAGGCRITIADKNELGSTKYEVRSGEKYLDQLDDFDVVIKSPGIPPLPELAAVKEKLTSPTQIFFDSIAGSGALVIGVTGSKGKSTTSSLLYDILKNADKNVFLVGNIGEPAILHLSDAKPDAIFVMEMSSYQLLNLNVSPAIALVTSFFPDHMDYHGSIEAYFEAKKNIARWQKADDVVFYCDAFKETKEIAMTSKGKKIGFSSKDSPVTLDEILLKGEHNISNIAGAFAVAMHLGIDRNVAINTIKAFKGLPHRLESIAISDNIEWINDSISTTPESAIAALDALGDKVTTVILGGQDRGYDFSFLTARLIGSSVKTVILLPESGARIRNEIEKIKTDMLLIDADDMKSAVESARENTNAGIVLLSPASPSYGHFKNFEDRGNQFATFAKN